MTDTTTSVIVMLIDETGSMMHAREETLNGVNAYFKQVKDSVPDPLRVKVGALMFDAFGKQPITRNAFEPCRLADWQPIPLDRYNPRGWTPLYDAIGHAIGLAGDLTGGDIAVKVVLVIQTDGHENSSKEHTNATIKALLADKQKLGWEVVFIGADLPATDAIGRDIGTQSANTMAYNTQNSRQVYASMARNTADYMSGARASMNFNDQQRADLEQKGDTQK